MMKWDRPAFFHPSTFPLVPLRDGGLEKLYVFLRFLLPLLPGKKGENPLEVLAMVDMEKLAVRKKDQKDIGLKRGGTKVDPLNYGGGAALTEEEHEALQQQLKNGSRHAVEATFRQVAEDAFEDLVDGNYKFYKKVSEDDEVSKEFFARLFEWYIEGHKKTPPKK